MKIGIVVPSIEEIKPIVHFLNPKQKFVSKKLQWYKGEHKGITYLAVVCGIGKVNSAAATQMLIDTFNPDKMLMFGVCGAIDENLDIGDALICTSVMHHDFNEEFLTQNEPVYESCDFLADKEIISSVKEAINKGNFDFNIFYGRLVTGEAFIEDNKRDEIQKQFCPYCVDMETAAFAQVCVLNEKPFLAIRTVTDTPKKQGLSVFRENLKKASFNVALLAKITLDSLK